MLAPNSATGPLLLVDNYDSFVYNLARYFEQLGQPTLVVRNDKIELESIETLAPRAIVISPGPRAPEQAGCSLDVVRDFVGRVPILGVCLGHQVIAAALGARIVRATEPVHGRGAAIHHAGQGLFAGLTNPFAAARYHSLVVERQSLPPSLEVTAWTEDGTVMAIEHRQHPLVGWQFHPESILTDCGHELLSRFLTRCMRPPTASQSQQH